MADEPKAKAEAPKKAKRYFIVNPAGAVHEVTREHAAELLKRVGYRMATEAEVEKYQSTPIQRADAPIARPFSTNPDEA